MILKKESIILTLLSICKIYSSSPLPLTAFGEILTTKPYPIIQILTTYGINNNYLSTGFSGNGSVTAPTTTENLVTIFSGTGANSYGKINSKTRLNYQPGQGAAAVFTAVFPEAGTINTTRIIGIGNDQDGFFFGFNGVDFGILHRSSSSGSLVNTWIAQSSWNGTPVTFDPTKGNVFKIQFQYLGFGAINFFVEDPNIGVFILVHQIKYANQNTIPSLLNPSLQLMAQALSSSGTNSAVTIKNGSMACFNEGPFINAYDARNSAFSIKTTSTTFNNNQSLIVIKNNTGYQGKINQVTVYPDFLYLFNGAAGTTNTSTYSIYLNASFTGGSPTFTPINTNKSVMSYDTGNYQLITGSGKLIFSVKLDSTSNFSANLFNYRLQLLPGETLTCICNSAKSTSDNVGASISWKERF